MKHLLALASLLLLSSLARAAEDDLLLHWNFDEGRGAVAADTSSRKTSGQMTAKWGASPSGGAALLEGTGATVVKADLPPANRLGRGSWTVMAWVKPQQFSIDSAQNQRRLFAYGAYPQAFFCVDILSNGTLSLYQVYDEAGKSISAGAGSSASLTEGKWAQVAVVCNRQTRVASIYINGRARGEQNLPPEFNADLGVSGEFTVGNSWQNYWGAADEVRLFRRALSRLEVRSEFDRSKNLFGVVPTPAENAADALEAVQQSFVNANKAWAKHDYAGSRRLLAGVVANPKAPPHFRSYAQLRLAQSFMATKQAPFAKAQLVKIASNAALPQVHRDEAAGRVRELDRVAKGLPPRDPAATRVKVKAVAAPRYSLFISPKGNDTNSGTLAKPLASLQNARDKARALLARKNGGVEIVLLPGEYRVEDTLELSPEDSGTASSPVVYRAQKPGTAVLYGGARLSGFTPVTEPTILDRLPSEARGKVVQLDLKARGISDYGALGVRGFGQPASPPTLELYVNGKPMTLARWPNAGFVKPTKLVEAGDKGSGKLSVLEYDDPRPARWTKASDAWMFGYFHWLWADATAKIGAINSDAKTITTAQPYDYGGGMNTEQGIIYYVFNLLEEIDRPGEWFLDRDSGVLYLYPPTDLSKSTVEMSLLSRPMISATNLSNARFEGIVFDLARGDGIVLSDSSDCLLAGCTVKRMAGSGIRVLGGARDTLLSCDIQTIGRRATEVVGGDRETLTRGDHLVANCSMSDFGRIDRTYTPGVQLEGVGNRVAHNLFFNCPSSAMRIEGNDHTIEFNEVRDAVLESDDQGALELFGNPSYRGVVFRHNLLRRIGSGATKQMMHGQAGIRFDDAISGMLVYGNVFDRASNGNFGGVQINSGRDNVFDNNLFMDCAKGISGGYYSSNNVWKQLRAGQKSPGIITSELYRKRYPQIATMLDEPAQNSAWRNIFLRCGNDVSGDKASLDQIGNAVSTDKTAKIGDAARGNVRLQNGTLVSDNIGFRPIPVDEIGLYRDSWRALRK